MFDVMINLDARQREMAQALKDTMEKFVQFVQGQKAPKNIESHIRRRSESRANQTTSSSPIPSKQFFLQIREY